MRKEYLYIGGAVLAVIVVMLFITAQMVSEQHGNSAVEELRARAASVAPRVMRPLRTDIPTYVEPSAAPKPPESPQHSSVFPDAIVAYERLVTAMKETEADAQWEATLKLMRGNWGEWTEEEQALVSAYLDAHRELILGLQQLLGSGEPLFELDYSQGFKMELPNFLDIRKVTWLLLADATLAAVRGDYKAILNNYTAFSNMADILTEQPVLISQMMRAALLDTLCSHVGQTLRGEDMPPDVFGQIIHLTAAASYADRLSDAIAFEGFFMLEAFNSIRAGDIDGAVIPTRGVERFLMRLYGSAIARPFLNMDETAYARFMNGMSDAMALPYYTARPVLEQLLSEISALPPTRVLTNIAVPNLSRIADAQARTEAHLGLVQLGLAVEHYHGQHGTYPDSLEQIAPLLGGALPLDPYTGQSFVYKPGGNGFQLYSARGSVVGANKLPRPSFYDAQGNIVWRYAGE